MPLRKWLANVQAWRKSIVKRTRYAANVGLGLYVGIGMADRLIHPERPNGHPTIQQRTEAVRDKLRQNTSYQVQTDQDGPVRPGQWWNWGNWPNYWNNWGNQWLNFGN